MEPLVNWSHEETRALIGVWSEGRIQRGLEESCRNESVYREVSGRLAAVGVSRSAKQCRQKIKKLKQEYRKIKSGCEGSGHVRETFRWYDAMDAVMSDSPAATENLDRSDTMILEFMISDVEAESSSITDISQSCSTPSDVAPLTTPDPRPCSTENPQEPRFYSVKVEDYEGPSTSSTETSAAVKTSIQDKPLRSWSNKEVQTLLTLWANPAIQRELCRNVRNNQVYAGFSAKLASLGFNKPPQKCREKIKKLKQEYKRIKSGHHIGGSSNVWFAIMDEVLSSQGAAAKHSETAELSSFSTVSSSPTQSAVLDMDMDDDIQWLPDEVQVMMTLWAQPNIQKQLLNTATSNQVYTYLSNELAMVGFNKTPHQCYLKVDDLKEEYRRLKQMEQYDDVKSDWFAILDGVLDPGGEASKELDSSAVKAEAKSSDDEYANESPTITDVPGSCSMLNHVLPFTTPGSTPCYMENPQEPSFYSVKLEDCDSPSTSTRENSAAAKTSVNDKPLRSWSNKEVQTLLTLWANPAVQRELCRNVRNNQVYAGFSAKLASLGFNKPPIKCREKIKKLKQEYKRIKSGHHIGGSSNVWFAIMDEVLSSQGAAAKRLEKADPSCTVSSSPTQSAVLDMDMDDDIQWLPDEVQVMMTLWTQPNIQKQLLNTATSDQVYTYLSNELAMVGFKKTPHQCRLKVDGLKEEYRRLKQVEQYGDVKSDWFVILDSLLDPDGEASKELDSSAETAAKSSGSEHETADALRAVWTSDEVKELLTRWAEESIQKQLRSTQRTERVYAQLSSALATRGFDKTTSQCRSKIRVLKQKYKRIKEQKDSKKQKSRWFAIMDKVLGGCKPATETKPTAKVTDSNLGLRQPSHRELSETVEGCRLSVPSLCLLVPTLRLMCAFAWQVVRSCNVAHYGKVEELVRSVTELAPELLTPREKVQLLLRLRARLVLELCLRESTADLLTIQPHLKVIQDLTISSGCDQDELEELEKSKSNFVEVVFTLLEDTEERRRFFKEVFPICYGQEYEVTLHTLVWKFISRLDNLLPSPDIKQTAEWLSTSDSVLEECAQLVLEPDQLKELLHFHQQQSGRTNKCFSQVQNMFLPTLSLRPKANTEHLASEQQEEAMPDKEDEEQFDFSEDEESAEENQSDDAQILEDCSKGNEDAELRVAQRDGLTSADCSNLNQAPVQLQPCSLCPYSDSRVSGLLEHIRREHLFQESSRPPSSEPGTDGDLQKVLTQDLTPEVRSTTDTCNYCGKVFKDISTLNNHVKTHTLPFHCDKCDRKYSSRASLTVHRRIHTGETPYLCSHCGQGFRSSNSLGLHVRIHTGDRRHKCPICGKTSIQHLSRHMRMHRGEKNYLCSECGKAFLSSGELRLHMRFHSGERPYACKHCGRGFIVKCLLTVHMRQHTGESPYKCLLCPKSFHTLRAQKRHMMIHSNRKSFQCLTCGRIFRHEGTFKIHVETHR